MLNRVMRKMNEARKYHTCRGYLLAWAIRIVRSMLGVWEPLVMASTLVGRWSMIDNEGESTIFRNPMPSGRDKG